MRAYELDWNRLPLQGACNVRELGGYPVAGGGQTRYHRLLRSDSLARLSDADIRFLHGYGVRAVIDLRDPFEVAEMPDVSLGDDVATANYPLLQLDLSSQEEVERRFRDAPPSPAEFYDMILAGRDRIADCLRFVAEAPDGCVLFHCAVGKDRTGVLAMLLMRLAGCDRWDCVSNYMQTRVHLMRDEAFVAGWERALGTPHEPLQDSPTVAIEHALDVVDEAGGIDAFLAGCGVGEAELAAVRRRLCA